VSTAEARASRPPLWRDVRVLRVLGQAVFVLAVVWVMRELGDNLTTQLDRQGRDLSFDFVGTRAGFGISEGIEYSPNETFLKAGIVGLMNTIRVSGFGILLATILGLVVGVARLSPNWLVRKIAQVYVELVRNTPVFIQIIFWFFAVFLPLGPPEDGDAGPLLLSNRIIALIWPRWGARQGAWWLVVLGGLVVAALVWRARTRRWERTGQPHHRFAIASLIVAGAAALAQLATGSVRISSPSVTGLSVEGGLQVSASYGALLVALVIYTATFIAEIVRGSILAVQKGQKEAGEALGLSPFQQLRFVVLPQAMRIAIPPINSQYLNLTKNSSLAIAIGYADLVTIGRTTINQTGAAFQVLLLVMLTYLTLSLIISFAMNMLNRSVALKGAR